MSDCRAIHRVLIAVVSRYSRYADGSRDIAEVPIRTAEIGCAQIEDAVLKIVKDARDKGIDISARVIDKNTFEIDIKLLDGLSSLHLKHVFEVARK